ncbi:MAG: CDP-glucose 4,6-dehydratase [Caulobacteraceae bacterium]
MEDLVGPIVSFWRGRRVFLTGHTGFKGAWLALWLTDLGAEVTGYSLPAPTSPSLFELARVRDLVRHLDGDVRDEDKLSAAIAQTRPEVVFHMAAQSLVRVSYEEPVATYATNVMGTVNLLDAVRRTVGVRAVVCVTSDKCYENHETDRPYREGDAMGGFDPYSSSKGCSELVVSAYRRSFFNADQIAAHGVGVASARAGNVIGGGDWARDRLVPDVMRAFVAGTRPLIRFSGAIRPWQHVLEPLSGYMLLAERLWGADRTVADGWNFGADEEDTRTVGWVVDRLAALWDAGAGWELSAESQPHEAAHLNLDSGKARSLLGWRPAWSLDEALRQTVAWYRALASGVDMRDFTLRQIESYPAPGAGRERGP